MIGVCIFTYKYLHSRFYEIMRFLFRIILNLISSVYRLLDSIFPSRDCSVHISSNSSPVCDHDVNQMTSGVICNLCLSLFHAKCASFSQTCTDHISKRDNVVCFCFDQRLSISEMLKNSVVAQQCHSQLESSVKELTTSVCKLIKLQSNFCEPPTNNYYYSPQRGPVINNLHSSNIFPEQVVASAPPSNELPTYAEILAAGLPPRIPEITRPESDVSPPLRIFVGGLEPETTSDSIVKLIYNSLGIKIKCFQLRTKYPTYSSFCLITAESNSDIIMRSNIWPSRAKIMHFISHPKQLSRKKKRDSKISGNHSPREQQHPEQNYSKK